MKSEEETVIKKGHIHPITHVYQQCVDIFSQMGFEVATGSEIEDEYHNFDALNIPAHHPARDMQDTFWLKNMSGKLLRTHTSAIQVRYMKEHGAPCKIIAPGKVFRNEATDRTHETQFHQLEGLVVGKDISLAHLKYTLNECMKKIFGDDVVMRLRPGYFAFVEPGVEIDMQCSRCVGKGCASCKFNGWIEILGAGMVHPKVLEAGKIHPEQYSGFAFGLGIDRIAMIKYGIDDVRSLYNGDLRLVSQF